MITTSESTELNRPGAFFDRDGVINIDFGYVHSLDRLELSPGAAAALRACNNAGFLVFIVTNQSGVARGFFDEETLVLFHSELCSRLALEGAVINDIRYCPHLIDASVPYYRLDCSCRKPRPGMILDLTQTWSVDLSRSFLIGDKASDMAAAAAAGIKGYRFDGGNLDEFVRPIIHETLG